MTTDVEELLRDGMERFTADVQAPAGLASMVGRLRRRRQAVRAVVACGAAAVTAAAAVAVITGVSGGLARHGADGAQARTVAYVVRRVEDALTGQHLVFRGTTTSTTQTSVTWAYGPRYRFEEFTEKACGRPLPNLACSGHGGSVPALASGTAPATAAAGASERVLDDISAHDGRPPDGGQPLVGLHPCHARLRGSPRDRAYPD